MLVMKFGGASLATTGKLQAVIDQIALSCAQEKVVVVVSAMGSTTDWLVREDVDMTARIIALLETHTHALSLCSPAVAAQIRESIVELADTATTMSRAELHSYGELLSSEIVSSLLRERGIAADDLGLCCVAVEDDEPRHVDLERTRMRLRAKGLEQPEKQVLVVGGFAGRDRHGVLHLLGRGGSDTSATSVGVAVGARVIELWKDIDGIHAEIPSETSEAFAALNWEDADAIARSGMRVLHELSIEPAWRARIPIHVRHTGHPEAPGTWIEGGRSIEEVGERVA